MHFHVWIAGQANARSNPTVDYGPATGRPDHSFAPHRRLYSATNLGPATDLNADTDADPATDLDPDTDLGLDSHIDPAPPRLPPPRLALR